MRKVTNMHNWIAELPEDVAGEVLSHCSSRKLVDGQCLFYPGDAADACYRLVKGQLKVCNISHSGHELVHTSLAPGDCIGEWSLLADEPRMNQTYASGDSEVLVLPKARFDDLYDKHPEIARALNRVMARRLRLFFMLAEDAALLPLRQRLARIIVRMGLSVGEVDAQGRTVIGDISHDELARMVGSTRQSVSRELKKLKEDGSIVISYGKLIIPDIDGLGQQYDQLIGVEPVVADYGAEG